MTTSRFLLLLVTGTLILAASGWAAKKRATLPPAAIPNATEQTDGADHRTPFVTEKPAGNNSPSIDDSPSEMTATSAAIYDIPWQSVNGGGGPSSSTNYSVNASVGQSTIGSATSTNYEAGIGYWYGTAVTAGGCSCPYQSDFDEDGFLTALDLGAMIDILFAGDPDVADPDCPTKRADFDCDGFSTALDLGGLIDHLFAGGPGPCDPCAP